MLPATEQRVPQSTDDAVNRRIERDTRARLEYYAARPTEIAERLRELDEEWDVERMLEANAAALALGGTLAALLGRRRWLLLPGFVTAFLLQHAVQGWCPPLPLLRRVGFRTAREIETERNALRALRGDFSPIERAQHRLQAVLAVFGFRR